MRARVIAILIKEDVQHYRRFIAAALLLPWLPGLFFYWKGQQIEEWIQLSGFSQQTSAGLAFAVLFAIPFLAVWLAAISRVSKEAKHHYYAFAQILPVTLKEMTAAKFLFSFFACVGTIIWLFFCWSVCTRDLTVTGTPLAWASMLLVSFIFTAWLGLHHGAFFRDGGKEPWLLNQLMIGCFYLVIRSAFMSWLASVMAHVPALSIFTCLLAAIAIWYISWQRVLTFHRKRPISFVK